MGGDPARAVALMDEHLGNVEDRLDLDRDTRKSVDLSRLFATELTRSPSNNSGKGA